MKEIKKMIDKRNARLQHFVEKIQQYIDKNFRIIGNPNHPMIIMDDKYCLSAYVKNFELFFVNKPHQGEIIYSIKLTHSLDFNIDKVLSCLNNSEHRKLYKILYDGTDLYVSGHNSQDKLDNSTMYPVFSRFNMKLYFSKENAQKILEKYKEYPLKIL